MQLNPESNTNKAQTATRISAIDQFRGFAILLMVLANYFNNINTLPAWLKHAPDIGYTVIDLVAPLFVFAIGLTYGMSFRRRFSRYGGWRTYNHFISRNLALIGLGFLITLGGILSSNYPPTTNWGLLQALGAAGLITLPFIQIKAKYRWIIGFILLVVYQVLLDRYWLDAVINAVHNGPQGALSWGAMLIIATSLGDLYQDQNSGKRWFPWLCLIILVIGSFLAFYIPISKHRASASYVLVSIGLSGIIFFTFHLFDSRYHLRVPILTEWGKNPLLLYILHGLLLGIFMLPPYPGWYFNASLWLVILQAAALVAVLSWIGLFFNRRGWFLTI
jgi:predicted acyltransferase